MSESEKEALRKLVMIISDLRAKDEERYEAHVNFMNETIKMIRAIESQMNKHWETVLDSLKELNESINANLDSLLTGINPKGLRETSKSLREIMDTMNKSVQSMNLEKVLSELKVLQSGTYAVPGAIQAGAQQQPEQITAGSGLTPPSGLTAPAGPTAPAASSESNEWVDPNEAAKKKKEEEEPHLLKPSDLWGTE
jgi:vesicle coat complex subunit